MTKQWYVLQVHSGFEYKVRDTLAERIAEAGMDDIFGEVLIPTEGVVEIRGEKERRSERKFFPGYVLVEMTMSDQSWHLVNGVPRVIGFIGGDSKKPTPITQREIDRILEKVQEGAEQPKPKVLYAPGEVIRIVDGPFKDFTGIVEKVDYEKNRVQVEVQILGRSTPVDLDFGQVAKS